MGDFFGGNTGITSAVEQQASAAFCLCFTSTSFTPLRPAVHCERWCKEAAYKSPPFITNKL